MIKLHTDSRTTQFEVSPPSVAQMESIVDSWLTHWAEHGYGYCAVTTYDSPDVIGLTGIRVRDFHGVSVLNLGYRFWPEVWGRGYAVEAAQAIVDWRARVMPWKVLIASVNLSNERSGRVAERVGFAEYTEEIYDGALSRHFRLDAIGPGTAT